MSWTLANGELRNKENPDRFWIPEKWERNSLEAGDYAKLIFETEDDGGERMWVQVVEAKDGNYVGTLANTPFFMDGVEYGDTIAFKAENIIDTHYGE